MSAMSEARLIQAVHAHLDHLHALIEVGEYVPWPEELVTLTDWKPQEAPDGTR